MITRMRIRNFKSFGPDSDWFPLGKLTLILGANASGKSTILQALLLLAQSWRQPLGFAELHGDGDLLQLGAMWNLSHRLTGAPMCFALEFGERGTVELEYSVDESRRVGLLRSVRTSPSANSTAWHWRLGASEGLHTLRFALQDSSTQLRAMAEPFADEVLSACSAAELEWAGREKARVAAEEEAGEEAAMTSLPALQLILRIEPERAEFSIDWPTSSERIGELAVVVDAPYFDRHRYGSGVPTMAEDLKLPADLYEQHWSFHQKLNSHIQPLYLLRDALAELAYLGPSRAPGKRLYTEWPGPADSTRVGHDGRFTAAVLDHVRRQDSSILDRLNASLVRQGVPYKIRLETVGHPTPVGLALRLVRVGSGESESGPEFAVDLCDVGFGVSQLLPILTQLFTFRQLPITKDRFRLLVVEQPELHLHPAWQAELASEFLESYVGESGAGGTDPNSEPVQSILETHSETMVLRVARLIRNGRLAAAQPGDRREFQILAVGQAPNKPGTTEVRAVDIDEDGWFDRQQFFEGFFADRVDEELA